MQPMKTLCLLGAALLAVAAFATADEKKEAAFDAAKLVGDWTYVEGTRAGEKIDKERLEAKVTIKKDELHIPAGPDMKFVMAYKIDTTKSPAAIDMDIKDGPVKEGKAVGIIALDGDTLKLCYDPMGAKRPEKFESTKDNGAFYFVLKRAR
jgi:uncharacterized protein (TIGR03067 family)